MVWWCLECQKNAFWSLLKSSTSWNLFSGTSRAAAIEHGKGTKRERRKATGSKKKTTMKVGNNYAGQSTTAQSQDRPHQPLLTSTSPPPPTALDTGGCIVPGQALWYDSKGGRGYTPRSPQMKNKRGGWSTSATLPPTPPLSRPWIGAHRSPGLHVCASRQASVATQYSVAPKQAKLTETCKTHDDMSMDRQRSPPKPDVILIRVPSSSPSALDTRHMHHVLWDTPAPPPPQH